MSLKLWTIYERPAEYPNLYVARESEVGGDKDEQQQSAHARLLFHELRI